MAQLPAPKKLCAMLDGCPKLAAAAMPLENISSALSEAQRCQQIDCLTLRNTGRLSFLPIILREATIQIEKKTRYGSLSMGTFLLNLLDLLARLRHQCNRHVHLKGLRCLCKRELAGIPG